MTAILSVVAREGYTLTSADKRWETFHEAEPRVLYHSRRGLTTDKDKATQFKTLKHALRVARKKYSPRLAYENAPEGTYLSRDLKSWTATTISD